MIDELLRLLESFKLPVYRQGGLPADQSYPDTFITFWNSESEEAAFYSNKALRENCTYEVNVYSTDIRQIYLKLQEIIALLKKNKWILTDAGHDVASDEPTHQGRGISVTRMTERKDE